MQITLLCRNDSLYSHKRILESAESRGHKVLIYDTTKCYMFISNNNSKIYYRGGEDISDTDAVLPRIGSSVTLYGTSVVRHFEMLGINCINSSLGISNSRDKLRAMQLLAQHGVNIPKTAFAHSHIDTQEIIKLVGGAPLIIKLLEGTQGVGVILTDSDFAAENIINAFKGVNADILIQEYIKEASGTDIRCFVVGDKVVASMERKAVASQEFRSNIHRGGVGRPIKITEEEEEMAIKASKIMGLNISGVDIIRSGLNGPMVLEVNSSPGLKGIEECTNIDVAGEIIRFIESGN